MTSSQIQQLKQLERQRQKAFIDYGKELDRINQEQNKILGEFK